MVFLESYSKLLLLMHAGLAVALIGSVTHLGVVAAHHLREGHPKQRAYRRYVRIVWWLYLLTVTMGILVYPAFRVYVRGHYLDGEIPLATGFFEVKEHWVGIGLGMVMLLRPLAHGTDLGERSAETTLVHLLSIGLTVVVWLAMTVGFVLNMLRSV